ncbi:lectin CPL-like [Salvia splendens]|uniref:lectin CPL-like n=1 Tax=Salvia splendens TaxID=180675 RepID=UPI001102025B|nr:lectin CPL-like [Salvia splendens]
MDKLSQTLIPVLSSIALLLATTARSQTTSFQYDFNGGPQPSDLVYQGDAHFPSDSTYLRLTKTDNNGNALASSVGRAVYSKPITLWEAGAQVDLETIVEFIIHPKSGDSNPADGLTFFIQPFGSPIGDVGTAFGVFDKSGLNQSVFAVEFDIYPNSGLDPSYRHVGIDIGSQVSKNTTDVENAILGQVVTARIDYEEATKLISVHVTAGSKTYEVSHVYDLSTILPQQVQVGISASTGAEVAVHDLISWYFTSTLVHTGANIRQYVSKD